MRGIKIPQQVFELKMPGGLCVRGGVFVGHYGTFIDGFFFLSVAPVPASSVLAAAFALHLWGSKK